MAKENDDQDASSASNQVITINLSKLSKDEYRNTINDMTSEWYNLHVTLKSLNKKNARIKSFNALLIERNALLETELLELQKAKKDCELLEITC